MRSYNDMEKEEKIINGILNYKAKSEYKQASIIIIRNVLKQIEEENNNGWIKIDSEDQIKDFQNEFCWVIIKSGEVEKMYIHSSNKSFVLNMCTHYQPIEKPKPPLY